MQQILYNEVSVYADFVSPRSIGTIPLYQWLINEGYKDEILQIRKCNSAETIKKLKAQLPAVTPSGIFVGKRSSSSLKQHSGFICIDIDGKDNPQISNWQVLKSKIGETANVAFAGLSASGNGLYAIIPIAHPEKHQQHFNALQLFFLTSYEVCIDKACKDVCRLRGISYDDAPYVNHHAEPISTCLQLPIKASVGGFGAQSNVNASDKVVAEILSLKIDIAETYSDWFSAGCAIANLYGEAGRGKFHDISSLSTKYNRDSCDRQYDACLKTKYNYSTATLAYLLKKYRE